VAFDDIEPYLVEEDSGDESETGVGKSLEGILIFEIPHASVEARRADFSPSYTNYWPGLASPTTWDPSLYRYRMKRHAQGRPGFSRITCWYRKLPMLDRLDAVHKTLVYVRIFGKAVKHTLDKDDKIIEGPVDSPSTAEEHITEWRVVQGTNISLEPTGSVVLKVAYTTPPASAAIGLIGKTNSATGSFGGAFSPALATETLLYRGFTLQEVPNRFGLWVADHEWLYNPDKWPEGCKSQQHIKRIVEVEVKTTSAGGLIAATPAQKAYVTHWEPTGDVEDRDITKGSDDFSSILDDLSYIP